jgi:hypothetical protein
MAAVGEICVVRGIDRPGDDPAVDEYLPIPINPQSEHSSVRASNAVASPRPTTALPAGS